MYMERMRRLVPDTAHGKTSPHKMCMVLAVIDLARAGALTSNRIHFESPALLERYYANFEAVAGPGQHPNPYMPFYHLTGKLKDGSPSFWHLMPRPGCDLKKPRKNKDIQSMIAWAYLDDELFAILQSDVERELLADDIARHWFQRDLSELQGVVARSQQISSYEKGLRDLTLAGRGVREVPKYIRDPAFRRVVTEKYDYRCAATRVRVLLPDGRAMVQAAHLYPVSEGANDDPRNGLALTPDIHWAMDNFLIAPGPDLKWHVSKVIDACEMADYGWLNKLRGRSLLLPADSAYHPNQEALAWRYEAMKNHDFG